MQAGFLFNADGAQLKKFSDLIDARTLRTIADNEFPFAETNEALPMVKLNGPRAGSSATSNIWSPAKFAGDNDIQCVFGRVGVQRDYCKPSGVDR